MTQPIRDSVHPPLGRRTPARTEDFFDPAQLEELRAYSRPVKRVRLVSALVTGIVELALIFVFDLGPAVAGWVEGWAAQVVLVGAVFAATTTVIDLPASYWSTMVHDRRHGLSNQSLGLWIADQVKEVILSSLLVAVFLVPVYWAVRNVGAWWLIGGLIFVGLSLVMAFVYPVLIMPRFNTFTPMPEGVLRSRIEDIAVAADTTIEGVYTMDGSKRSRRGNAFVAGFGPTKRVVVFDTIIPDELRVVASDEAGQAVGDTDQAVGDAGDADSPDAADRGETGLPLEHIAQIVAHEIGHYRLHHIPKTFPFTAARLLVSLAFVQFVGGNETVLGWAGVEDLGEPGALPLFLLAFGAASAILGIGSAWLSRRNEREADLEALELLARPSDFVAMWPGLVAQNKADLEPGWWQRMNASHPEVAERMQFGLDWAAANGVAVTRPVTAPVPDAAAVTSDDARGAMG